MILWSLLAIVIICFDQAVKMWVSANIGPTDVIEIIPGVVDFVNIKNTGAAFSFLSDKSYGIVILSMISIAFCAAVIWYVIKKRPKSKLMLLSLALMFAGAMGNAIDRIFRGSVIDFIEIRFMNFPVFNIADIMITVGAGLIILSIILADREKARSFGIMDEKSEE